jgi:pyruvate dehydrogenase E2 component (dihydrolipoamide acetyltransferase)
VANAADYEDRELSRMRQTIARRMTEAKQAVPHFYVTSEIDMGEALKWRQQLNVAVEKEGGVKISVNDMIIKAVAKALHKYPSLNASYVNGKLRLNKRINVAMAVALDEGLITPVVSDADKKSLGTIAADARQLIEKARSGSLRPEDFQGGTFTVSNLGMYDVESFVAIINPPQAAILAIGSTKPTVVVKAGTSDNATPEFGVVQLMKVTISADHRVTDGAVAAQFLQELKRVLQNPLSLLV